MVPSVLLLTKNEEKNVKSCLEMVYSQDGYPDPEVILVDSGSRDRTVEIASSYPVRLIRIRADEFHHGKTRNMAASLASGDHLVFLSADAVPADRTWLRSLLRNFEDPRVGAVYGRQLPKPDATPERKFFMQHRYGSERIVKSGDPPDCGKYRHYQFSDVNGAIRRDVWARTRFPEDSNAYEDFCLAIRILKLGYSIVYDPSAAVYHSHNYRVFYSFKQYFDTGVLYSRLGLWDSGHQQTLKDDGLHYVLAELRYLQVRRVIHRIPYVLMYEMARYLGLVAGKNERFFPHFLKKRVSSHGFFN